MSSPQHTAASDKADTPKSVGLIMLTTVIYLLTSNFAVSSVSESPHLLVSLGVPRHLGSAYPDDLQDDADNDHYGGENIEPWDSVTLIADGKEAHDYAQG